MPSVINASDRAEALALHPRASKDVLGNNHGFGGSNVVFAPLRRHPKPTYRRK